MNFEANKIAGAVLGTALGIMAVGIVAEMIYAPPHDHAPGYVIAVAEPGEGGDGGPAEAQVLPIADRLQTANAETGADDAKKCATCHTFDKGGPAKAGPNLWGIVGNRAAHMEGFGYSEAMEAKAQEGMTWTYDNLDHFLASPKGFIPETAMGFAGIKKPEERADVIAYLRTLSDNPEPLPPPTPAPTAEAPPADGAPAATPPADHAPAETPPAPTPPAEAAPATPPAETPAPAPQPEPQTTPAQAEPGPATGGSEPAPAPADSGAASSGDSGGAVSTPAPATPPAAGEAAPAQ